MDTLLRQQECPDVSTEQRRSSELVKRIRKYPALVSLRRSAV